ncbi:MAG: DUF503 domain-containing protein [Candidatus Omnitrophica bacterium]|nr:DUF503 domain-containing protein [Candidatus Omnitrophota bacterium]
MIIGVLQLELFIPHSLSLKAKRCVLRSIKDRTSEKFNVAISETDYLDKWQRSVLSIVTVSNEQKHCDQVLTKVERLIEEYHEIQIIDRTLEFI